MLLSFEQNNILEKNGNNLYAEYVIAVSYIKLSYFLCTHLVCIKN